MAKVINRTNFPDFNNNLEIRWRKSYRAFPKRASILYDREDVDVDTGDESSMGGYSVAKKKREGADFAFLNITQGYRKPWRIYEIGGETKVTWLMRRTMKYKKIQDAIDGIAESAAKRMEYDLTHRFTFANAVSYVDLDGDTVDTTVGDGLALLSTAHTVPGSSTTFRNRIANNPVLSKGALEAAEKLFSSQMVDDNGELTFNEATHIVVGNDPATVNLAEQYLGSSADITASQAGVKNPYAGKYGLIKLPYLATTAAGAYDSSKAAMWFLVNLNHKDAIVKVLEPPTFISPTYLDGREFETMDWKYACHAAYAIEIIDPRWIVGSLGDGTA